MPDPYASFSSPQSAPPSQAPAADPYAAFSAPPTAPVASGSWGAGSPWAMLQHPKAAPQAQPFDLGRYVGDEVVNNVGGAWDKLKGDASQYYQDTVSQKPKSLGDQWREFTAVPRLAGDAFNAAVSPGIALVHGAVVRPISAALEAGGDALGVNPTRSPSLPEIYSRFQSGSSSPFETVPITRAQNRGNIEGTVGLATMALPPGEAPGAGLAVETPGILGTTARVSPRAAKYMGGLLGTPDPAMIAAHAAGKPVTTAEMLGPSGRTALAATARRPGATGGAVEDAMTERLDSAPHTMLQDFTAATGISPHAARGDMEALAESNRQGVIRPAYDAALSQPVTMTPHLSAVLQQPEVIAAVNKAKRLVGTDSTEAGLQVNPDTGATNIDPITQQPIMGTQPNAVVLDQAKKFLAREITRDPITREPIASGPGASENVFIQKHLGDLTDALAGNEAKNIPPAIPGYRDALNAAGDTLKTEQAFKLGKQHILNSGVSAADVEGVVQGMSPSELEAYQGGQANALFDKAQNGILTPKKLLTQTVRNKLAASLGNDVADQFVSSVRQTKQLVDNARQISPQAGSQTAPLKMEGERQDAMFGPGIMGHAGDYVRDFGLGLVAGGGHGDMGFHLANLNAGRKIITKGAGILGDALTNARTPQAMRDEVGGILGATGDKAMTPDQLEAYLQTIRPKRVPQRIPALTWVGRPDSPPPGILASPAVGMGLLGQPANRNGP